MSIKSIIQILISSLIILIIGGVYFKYFDAKKNIIEEVNVLENKKIIELKKLENKNFLSEAILLLLQLIKKGKLKTKNQKPTTGPQTLIFSYSLSFNINIDLPGIKNKASMMPNQKMPPK